MPPRKQLPETVKLQTAQLQLGLVQKYLDVEIVCKSRWLRFRMVIQVIVFHETKQTNYALGRHVFWVKTSEFFQN